MRITEEADYALRIVSALAKCDEPSGAPLIAENAKIPPRFTMKILRKLALCGIVRSTRGVNGGYSLAVPSEALNIRQVVEAIDGKITVKKCLMPDYCCSNNPNKDRCRFHQVFSQLNALIGERLERISIAQITDEAVSVEQLKNIII